MKSRLIRGVAFAGGLLTFGASFAQMGPMRAPRVPQAIGTHMEQKRTLEQREAIEAKAAAAPPPETTAPKKTSTKKLKKARGQSSAKAESRKAVAQ